MVRHGQASFGAEDYDNLSELGKQQSFWLGQQLQQMGYTPDVAIDGSLKRHAQTLAEIKKSVSIANSETKEAFVEISLGAIVEGYRKKFNDLPRYEQDKSLLNIALRKVLTAWIENKFKAEDTPWAEFTHRVAAGLKDLESQHKSILIVTSGGTITAAVGAIQNLNTNAQVSMMLNMHNSSMTKLIANPNGYELHSLNNVAHLETIERKGSLTYV